MARGQPPHLARWIPVMGYWPNDGQAEQDDRVGVEGAWSAGCQWIVCSGLL